VNADPPLVIERLIPPIAPEDRDGVIALESASFTNPWTPQTFDVMVSSPASRLYVARSADAGIVAFCACWVFEEEIHINTIAVREGLRRRGAATMLLNHVLRDTGARRATLEVRRSNVAAIALYEKLGFKVTAIRPRYYEKPDEDGLILWLNP
jgi:ribosomal-protein-alanine N-acetyltransferase